MGDEIITTIQTDRGMNPWAGMTGSSTEEDANKSIKAANLNTEDFTSYPALEKYKFKDKILIAKNTKAKTVNVEKEFFSDLKKVDGTRLETGKTQDIGKLNLAAAGAIDFRELALFLIQAHIIITYWHIESNLDLTKEESNDQSYKAYFKGTHIYFTNKKHTESVQFYIGVEKNTGRIYIGNDL
jgi:hypothetical protein